MIAPTDHRPWPVPRTPWIMFMRWNDLAFLHWAVEPSVLQKRLPPGVPVDTFDGKAWLGITPFRMSSTRPRCIPPIPWLSTFPELNVRTYVTINGKAGIWFLSLDAASSLAVRGARLAFGLPYFDARMSMKHSGEAIGYCSERCNQETPVARFEARYRPCGEVYRSQPGSLDYWLTERYCLYVVRAGKLLRGDIHHAPWPLQPGEARIDVNTMAEVHGIHLGQQQPLVHFARRVDVVAWYLRSAD